MTPEPGHDPTEWDSAPRSTTQPTPAPQPVHYNSARHGNHVEESPELLRWRADLLMDEMMMGGVDVSAADGNRTFSGVDAPVVHRPQTPANGNSHSDKNGNGNHSLNNGAHSNGQNHQNGHSNGGPYSPQSNGHYRPVEPHKPTDRNGGYSSSSSTQQPGVDHHSHETPHTGEPRNFGVRNGDGREIDWYRPEPQHPDHHSDETQYGEPQRNDPGHDQHQPESRYTDSHYVEPRRDETYHANGRENGGFDSGRERGYSEPERHPDDGAGHYTPAGDTNGTRPAGPTNSAHPDVYSPYTNGEAQRQPPAQPSTRPALPPSPGNTGYDNQRYDPPRHDNNGNGAAAAMLGAGLAATNRPPANEPPVQPEPPSSLKTTIDAPLPTRPPLPAVEPARQPTPVPRPTPQPPDEHTQWATGVDKWDYQDFAATPQEQEDDSLFGIYPVTERKPVQESAVRQDPAQFVSAMSVVSSNKKRSTLLPRSSELDVDNLHREISDLHSEIAILLPVGNETSERARHLLDKAYSILQSDPSRSAEVEYYMQQVRTIVQRLHQSRQWSNLYRQRLNLYLWGWLGLSAMVLIATFLFQDELESALMWLLGVDANSWFVANWTTFIGTAFAGALGGAIGALYTMRAHARGEYSFFDRKYGLRGLILPFMGLIVGAVGYLVFGLIFGLVGIDPSESLTAAIIPMVSAFAFGFSQESIYGTRS